MIKNMVSSNSSYISVERVTETAKSGICRCDVCENIRDRNTTTIINGKSISLEELRKLEQVYKTAEENRQKIKVINNTWCVCQSCKTHIKMLPEKDSSMSGRIIELTRELDSLTAKKDSYKRGELPHLDEKGFRLIEKGIQWRKLALKDAQTTVKKLPLHKRIPLNKSPRDDGLWICYDCYLLKSKSKIKKS